MEIRNITDHLQWMTTILLCFFIRDLAGLMNSSCFSSKDETLNINCGYGNMVHITKVFYGYSYSNHCSHEMGDCIRPEKENFQCVGMSSCSIAIQQDNYGPYIHTCGKFSSYFQVEYQCVQASSVIDICNTKITHMQQGYIKTPNYPQRYLNSHNCSLTIEATYGQRINLTAIDMNLQDNSGCVDYLYLNDNHRTQTLCGNRTNKVLFESFMNVLKIQFKSNNTIQGRGAWLYFEAIPKLTTPKPKPTQIISAAVPSSRATRVPQNQHTPPTKAKQTPTRTTSKATGNIFEGTVKVTELRHIIKGKEYMATQPRFPAGEIIGGVLGTLLLVLIVLIGLLIKRRIRIHSIRHKTKTRESLEEGP